MKKLLILVIPALVFVLAGCSSVESEDKEREKNDKKSTQKQDKTSTEQETEAYDTNDDYIRSIMQKDPSKLNDKELAIYNEVNKQINNKAELSESDESIRADQRAMSDKRNAKSPDEQARIDEYKKQNEQQKAEQKGGTALITPPETEKEKEELRKIQQEQLKQREQQQPAQQQQQQQAPTEQPTQQVPTESNTPEQQEQEHETIEK